MMGLATGDLSELLGTSQVCIKLVTLLLRTGILPIGTERVRKGSLELVLQRLGLFQSLQQACGILAPIHTTMLLTGGANTFDTRKVEALVLERAEHPVERLQPESDGGEDFVLGFVGHDALFDIEAVRVGVKVEFGFIFNLEV